MCEDDEQWQYDAQPLKRGRWEEEDSLTVPVRLVIVVGTQVVLDATTAGAHVGIATTESLVMN